MSTSGVIQTTTTAKEIIQEALELVGALGEGELANTEQEKSLLRTLRSMCTMWQADGLNLFAVGTVYIFMQKGKVRYRLPTDFAGDRLQATLIASEYTPNRLSEDALEGATELTFYDEVPSHHTFVSVLETDGYLTWYEIDVNNGNSVVIKGTVSSDLFAEAKAYSIVPAQQERPMKVLDGVLAYHNKTTIPMEKMPRHEYERLTRKDSVGVPTQFYEDNQSTYCDIYFWPTSSISTMVAEMHVQRQLDAVFSVEQDVEFPPEWFTPLSENLAYRVSGKYGLPRFDTSRLKDQADTSYEMARGFDFEHGTSLYLQPESRGG